MRGLMPPIRDPRRTMAMTILDLSSALNRVFSRPAGATRAWSDAIAIAVGSRFLIVLIRNQSMALLSA
jgi:hypothetical protein